MRLGQKLEAVGQLAAGIAHEINTPTSSSATRCTSSTTRSRPAHPSDRLRALRDAAEAGAVPRADRGGPRGRGTGRPRLPARTRPGAFERATEGSSASPTSCVPCATSPTRPRPRRRRSTSLAPLQDTLVVAATHTSTSPTSSPSSTQAPPDHVRWRRHEPGGPEPRRERGSRHRGRDRRGASAGVICLRTQRDGDHAGRSGSPDRAAGSRRLSRGAHLRPVLHHQGRREGHGPGPRDRAAGRARAPRRPPDLRDRDGPGHHVPTSGCPSPSRHPGQVRGATRVLFVDDQQPGPRYPARPPAAAAPRVGRMLFASGAAVALPLARTHALRRRRVATCACPAWTAPRCSATSSGPTQRRSGSSFPDPTEREVVMPRAAAVAHRLLAKPCDLVDASCASWRAPARFSRAP